MRGRQFWVDSLGEGWAEILKPLLKDPYMDKVMNKLALDYSLLKVYPRNQHDVFRAFKLCPLEKLRVVIINTEPSNHTGLGPLAFSDTSTIHRNPCADQIVRCLSYEYDRLLPGFHTDFEHWAEQGILMLNRSLTSIEDNPRAHRDMWKKFFGSILYIIEKYKHGTIFLLWGKEAGKYKELLSLHHHVFTWEHPMKAVQEHRNWECPNFKLVDKLIESLNGERINW
jgi:uracil-DNA glycosylase